MSDIPRVPIGRKAASGQQRDLSAEDFARVLSRVASLFEVSPPTDSELVRCLRAMSGALNTWGKQPAGEAIECLRKSGEAKQVTETRSRNLIELPENLAALSANETDRILRDDAYTKEQLVELGFVRFGIARARLSRGGKDKVIEAVRSALEHEKSLEVIEREATRGGENRSV